MQQRIGTCGNCGGDVIGHVGPWYGINPPPSPKCSNCGAKPAFVDDTIEMAPRKPWRHRSKNKDLYEDVRWDSPEGRDLPTRLKC